MSGLVGTIYGNSPGPPNGGGIAPLVGSMALLSLRPVVTTFYVPETWRRGLDAVPCGHGG